MSFPHPETGHPSPDARFARVAALFLTLMLLALGASTLGLAGGAS